MTGNIVIDTLFTLPFGTVAAWVLGILAIITACCCGCIKLYQFFEKARTAKNESEAKDHMLGQHENAIEKLKETDTQIIQLIGDLSDKIVTLSKQVNIMQENSNIAERARLKNNIQQLYKICHRSMNITEIEKNTLEDLIDSYERHNGTNSFVHSIVEPEIALWDIIKERD